MIPSPSASACHGCGNRGESLIQLGVAPGRWDFLVALAGNPNTGKSTVFNALTGLRQHTGNWPGKTVTRAEGRSSTPGSAQDRRSAGHLLAAWPRAPTRKWRATSCSSASRT